MSSPGLRSRYVISLNAFQYLLKPGLILKYINPHEKQNQLSIEQLWNLFFHK